MLCVLLMAVVSMEAVWWSLVHECSKHSSENGQWWWIQLKVMIETTLIDLHSHWWWTQGMVLSQMKMLLKVLCCEGAVMNLYRQ